MTRDQRQARLESSGAAASPRIVAVDRVNPVSIRVGKTFGISAGILFTILAALFAVTGLASHVEIAEVLFAISASLCLLMMAFALTRAVAVPVPVRVRRHRR